MVNTTTYQETVFLPNNNLASPLESRIDNTAGAHGSSHISLTPLPSALLYHPLMDESQLSHYDGSNSMSPTLITWPNAVAHRHSAPYKESSRPAHVREDLALIKNLDPISMAKRIATDPQAFHSEANEVHLLDILQAALDDPQQRLGNQRPNVLLSLQDIAASSGKLPSRVKTLHPRGRELLGLGGESIIWASEVDGKAVTVREAIRREIVLQLQIQHRNILPILGISSHKSHPLSTVTPHAANGNAFQYLLGLDLAQRAGAMLRITCDAASALEYLHGLLPPIIHGDLHARNILVDAEGRALLCDFGLSRIKHEHTRAATAIIEGGRYRYLAPELLAAPSFRSTPASDCYAFGMTILQLATLQIPFAEYGNDWAASSAAQRKEQPRQPPRAAFGALENSIIDMLWRLSGPKCALCWTVPTSCWHFTPARPPHYSIILTHH
ncbi:kinase-like protein [Clavulina sp. PMI_390]|nr:kinase-like protein [Clavulina sp. PMI_390]